MINQEVQSAIGRPHQPLSELYKDIVLTPEEEKEAIERALYELRYTKWAANNRIEYGKKLLEQKKRLRYTKDQLWNYISTLEGFDIDSDNKAIVNILCCYFSGDPEFESFKDVNGKPFSLSKGILLFGGLGVGKTLLMELFRNNQHQSFQVVACPDVEALYSKNGPDVNPQTGAEGLKKFFGLVSLPRPNDFGQESLGFLFDDLGQELQNTKYFGTERNVMEEVLSQRYKRHLFTQTHITTNLGADQIRERYGPRVADRLKEMVNLVAFPPNAKSRRK